MELSDEQYFNVFKTVFNFLPQLFWEDMVIGLSDMEKIVMYKETGSLRLNFKVGQLLSDINLGKRTIKTHQRTRIVIPKEAFGIPFIGYSIPIINPDTNNLLGLLLYGFSMEKQDKLKETINQLQGYSQELAASSEEMSSSTEEISTKSENAKNLAVKAQEHISSMDDILDYIKSIANTTNLLGLNAAIESARAGEYGRGFSVVAGEIRKLAANSKESTGKINETLSEIKESINSLIGVFNEFSSASESQAAQAEQLATQSQKLSELSNALSTLSAITDNKQ